MKTCRFLCKEFELFFFLIGEFELLLSVFNLYLLKGNNNILIIFFMNFSLQLKILLFFLMFLFLFYSF